MSNGQSPMNPLVMVMAINDDTRFTSGERVALIRAVKHADNQTRLVHMSQSGIAAAIEVSRHTVQRAYAKADRFGYFSGKRQRRNARGHKVTDYWFTSQPPHGAGERLEDAPHGAREHIGGEETEQAMVQESTPSTSLILTSKGHPSKPHENTEPPCFCDDGCELCRADLCWDHGATYRKGECHHCFNAESRERAEAKHSEQARKGWHDDGLERNEQLDEYGEPLDHSAPAGYVSRRSRYR